MTSPRERYSAIGHGDMPVWNPVDPERLKALVPRLGLHSPARVLDIGCGRAALLRWIAAHWPGAQCAGVDPSPLCLAFARADLAVSAERTRVRLTQAPYDPTAFPDASQELVICLGAGHAVGRFDETLAEARRLLVPGGIFLAGEGYWRQQPHQDYLAFLGAGDTPLVSLEDNIAAAARQGFTCEETLACSGEEWSIYEDTYAANLTAYVKAHPDDPDTPYFSERIEAWRHAYEMWGRGVMGFAVYLFRRDGS